MNWEKTTNEELLRLSKVEVQSAQKLPVVVVLDNVRSHLNVGSVFRTCDAFLVEGIYCCGITGTPPHRDIQKTALGATETVSWRYEAQTLTALEALRAEGYKIAVVEQVKGSISLEAFQLTAHEKLAVIFGNEVDGVDAEVVRMADYAIEIPQWGSKHSLNVAVSAGIVLWELRRNTRK
ncbi:MAG: RNA methyltransferase [Chitinophagales bacterium]